MFIMKKYLILVLMSVFLSGAGSADNSHMPFQLNDVQRRDIAPMQQRQPQQNTYTQPPSQPKKPTIPSSVRWNNDLRSLFLNNQANIVAINIRTFFAIDTNQNGIIEVEQGEMPGTFVSAILGLEELKNAGVNTVHVLPVTPVGKIKALGTAGSLYALTSFTDINPQLVDKNSTLAPIDQVKYFIDECHKRGIRVIFDLPSCGAYDYFLSNPQLFEKDASGQPITPGDWTDVRLFKVKNANGSLNEELYNLHRDYIDMLLSLGVDGVNADVASIKPFEFWQRLISYTRAKDPQFLFLAEASDSWTKSPSPAAVFTPYDKLLEAGFDGYYGSYFKFKDIAGAAEFAKIVNHDLDLVKKYNRNKAVIGSFMTPGEQNPVVIGSTEYTQQLIWLNAILPVNSYITDGINTGDNYLYPYANKAAAVTYTDNNTYYVENGKFDIYNFSRTPGDKNMDILRDYVLAAEFKQSALGFLNAADFKTLPSSNTNVFAFSRSDGTNSLVVILNKNVHAAEKAKVKIKGLNDKSAVTPIKLTTIPKNISGGMDVELVPGEIQIFYIPDFKL